MKRLKDKIVLITGASSGFGEACALKLSEQGAKIILAARREQRILDLCEKINAMQTESYPMIVDVSRQVSINKAMTQLPTAWSNIDILINNAGLALGLESLAEGDTRQWDTMIDTNIKGVLYMTRKILPNMLSRNAGHIINMGSISGHETYPGGVVYCATKYALHAITEGLKKDILGSNIRVSLISPGMANTQFSQVRFDGDMERAQAAYKGMVPLEAEDVAETILFCITRPAHVNISEIVLLPTAQASTTLVSRRDVAVKSEQ